MGIRTIARHLASALQRRRVCALYDLISARDVAGEATLLNYGYAPVTVDVDDPRVQLYEEVARPVPLMGLSVLEVSSGRGGGAAFLVRRHGPREYVGVDLSAAAVAFCQARFALAGLSFLQGDAEALPFEAVRFDVVMNVEAAKNYPSRAAFVAEVRRVLRPGGHLLFADQCEGSDVASLRRELSPPGMKIVGERDLTRNVMEAIESTSESTAALIRRRFSGPLRTYMMQFAAVRGSRVHRRFAKGSLRYWNFTVRKAP